MGASFSLSGVTSGVELLCVTAGGQRSLRVHKLVGKSKATAAPAL